MDIHTVNITLAGCGSMGLPMARRLLSAGFNLSGFDIRPKEEFGGFAASMHMNRCEIMDSEVLISVVRDERETLALCFDEQAIYNRERYPRLLVICSTLSPRFVDKLVARLPPDVDLVDAPMSGAPFSAEQGNLTFMLGGQVVWVDLLMPLFNAMGNRVFHAGAAGAGMTLKVLNNYVAASSVVAVRRVLDMAQALAVDTGMLREVMAMSSGGTWFGTNFDAIDWAREGYGESNTIGILEKDVLAALDAVDELPRIRQRGAGPVAARRPARPGPSAALSGGRFRLAGGWMLVGQQVALA